MDITPICIIFITVFICVFNFIENFQRKAKRNAKRNDREFKRSLRVLKNELTLTEFLRANVSDEERKSVQKITRSKRLSLDMTKPCKVYGLEFWFNGVYIYKVGITKQKINQRFSPETLKSVTQQIIRHFKTRTEALQHEQKVVNRFRKFRYTGPSPLNDDKGETELFTRNLLNAI